MFVYKSEKEIAELSEYQREKYFDQKRDHEAKEAKDAAEKAAKDAVELALKDVDSKIADAKKEAQEEAEKGFESKITAVKEEYDRKLEDAEKAMKRIDDNFIGERVKSVENQIFDSLTDEQVKELVSVKGKTVELDNVNLTQKAPMSTFAGSVATGTPALVGPGHYKFYARDLMNVRSTTSNAIPYIQFTKDDALAGIGTTAEGAQKPNFGYVGEAKVANVYKIAGLLDVTDEMLDDVVGFRSWIAREAVLALRDVEDFKLYKGSGVSDIEGLWTSSSAAPVIAGIGGSELEEVCSAITSVRKNNREATAIVVSPAKWMQIYLNKDNENAYTYPVIFDTTRNVLTLAGVPVVYSNVFGDEEGLIGDFQRGAEIWQRKGISLAYGDQHVDNFGKNIVTIRVEERLALTKYYEDAFYKLFEATT
ncbi:MAG TPA: phage major capsid protein [Ureibacillus sp.]|nr:phage major capsid protein [Ureibacillus sp.]